MIYLDYAATTPISSKAADVLVEVSKKYYGNASSLHDIGSNARQIKEASAKVIAKALGVQPEGLWFTSGATESNFLAIQALLDGREDNRRHIISSRIEHASVINVFERLKTQGYQVHWVEVDETGRVDLNHLEELLTDQTALVSVQLVNSELGTIQPLKEIASLLKPKEVRFHSDWVQGFGKLPVHVHDTGVDAVSVSAHKIYGPKGIGAVWMNPKVNWEPLFHDPHQRKALRFGTDNVPGMAAFAAAVKETAEIREEEFKRISAFKKKFIQALRGLPFEVVIEGDEERGLALHFRASLSGNGRPIFYAGM